MNNKKIQEYKNALEKFNLINNEKLDAFIINDKFQELVINLEDKELFNDYLVNRHFLLTNANKINDLLQTTNIFSSTKKSPISKEEKVVVDEKVDKRDILDTNNIVELSEKEILLNKIKRNFLKYALLVSLGIFVISFGIILLNNKEENKLIISFLLSIFVVSPFLILTLCINYLVIKKNKLEYELTIDGYIVVRRYDQFSKLIIPNRYKSKRVIGIKEKAFESDETLTKVILGRNLEFIGKSAFYGCSNLKTVIIDIDSELKIIETVAFKNCEKLKSIIIPHLVSEIKNKAFSKCKAMSELKILANNLKQISPGCFEYCTNLKTVIIPLSIKSIEKYAFSNCSNLEEVKFSLESKLSKINEAAFINCIKLIKINFPNNLKAINRQAFSSCVSLSDVKIPNAIKNIEEYAFSNCNIKVLDLPRSITTIQEGAFYDNPRLKIIIVRFDCTEVFAKVHLKTIFGYSSADVTYINRDINLYYPDEIYSIWQKYWQSKKDINTIKISNKLSELITFQN